MTSMKQQTLLNFEDIQRKQVIVAEVDYIPSEMQSFRRNVMVIGLCISGKASYYYNMELRELESHGVAVTLPNSVMVKSEVSDDYRARVVIISKDYFDKLVQRASFVDYKKYYYRPYCHLTEEQFDNIRAIMRVLRIVSESNYPNREEGLESMLDLLFHALTRYRGEEGKKSGIDARNEQLFSKFYDLLMANYHEQHELAWYAEQLCLSPKYFSLVVRKTTEKSAAEWIDVVLVMQAKKLLRTRLDMTIQQVAYELGFKENASFCRFFKDQTGLRPKEYRSGK